MAHISPIESHLKLYQPVSLPQDMSSATEGTVASLTEHLMQCLQVGGMCIIEQSITDNN